MASTTPLQFVTKIRDLTVKEENRYFIVKDQGCLNGLVSYLHSSDLQVVLISLEAISQLSQTANIKETVRFPSSFLINIHINHKLIQFFPTDCRSKRITTSSPIIS